MLIYCVTYICVLWAIRDQISILEIKLLRHIDYKIHQYAPIFLDVSAKHKKRLKLKWFIGKHQYYIFLWILHYILILKENFVQRNIDTKDQRTGDRPDQTLK